MLLAAAIAFAFLLWRDANEVEAQTFQPPAIVSAVQLDESQRAKFEDDQERSDLTETRFFLKIILGPRNDIRDRLEAAQFLSKDLSRSDVSAIYAFLNGHANKEEENLAGLRTLKNNLLNTLQAQRITPYGLTRTLISIFHDCAQDSIIRDYAIQHLTTWYPRSAFDCPDAHAQIKNVLEEAVRENSSLAGTALLGMHCLAQTDGNFLPGKIDEYALRLTMASETPLAARITAVQICAERRIKESLPKIETLAEAQGQVALRISAISALGRLGNSQDILLLQKLDNTGDPALHPAIDAALKRLRPQLITSRVYFN
jgi:hypothetical protein